MLIPILALVFQGIPESIVLYYFVIGVNTPVINWRLLLKLALLDAVVAYAVRFLPLTLGIHIIILVSNLALLCSVFAKIEIRKSLMCSSIIMIVLVLFEGILNFLIVHLNFVTYQEITNSRLLWILFGLPQVMIIFLFTFLYRKKRFNLSQSN